MSAIIFGGVPGRVIELAAEGHLQLIVSPLLIDELRAILRRKFAFSDAAVYQAETVIRRISLLVEPQEHLTIITDDPPDDRVLEAAAAGQADAIVSGDRHLLKLKSFGAIPILNPRELLKRLSDPD